jgi:hypothetical protein
MSAPDMSMAASEGRKRRRFFRRGPWENAATVLIVIGIVMLMQPFFLTLFGYSFLTILAGTVGFIIVSHFPE